MFVLPPKKFLGTGPLKNVLTGFYCVIGCCVLLSSMRAGSSRNSSKNDLEKAKNWFIFI
jgi:hypothetical protein